MTLTKKKIKTQCVQIFSKAMDGQYGVFGNINPQKIEELNYEAFGFVRFECNYLFNANKMNI